MVQKVVDILFRAEGKDDRIPLLHEHFRTRLERGWPRAILKGTPLVDGTPSPCHLSSIVIAENVPDDYTWDQAAAIMDAWLARHSAFVRTLDTHVRTIHVTSHLMPDEGETRFYFYASTAHAASEAGCGLQVSTVRLYHPKRTTDTGG